MREISFRAQISAVYNKNTATERQMPYISVDTCAAKNREKDIVK